MPSAYQWPPSLYVTNGPTSVPMYSVFGYAGSMTMELTGVSGRFLVMLVKDLPPSAVFQMCPVCLGVAASKPLNPKYAVR